MSQRKHLLHLTIFLSAFIFYHLGLDSLVFTEAARPPPPVHINKCCRIGEYLDRSKICIAGGSEKWVPLVYLLMRKRNHEPRGEAPNFFRIQENTFPGTCKNPELFTGSNNIVLFSNGSLFLYEKSLVISPEDYCAEKDAALVCFPEIQGMDSLVAPKRQLHKVKKCCGPNFIYEWTSYGNGTCVPYAAASIQERHGSELLITGHHNTNEIINKTNFEIVYGFPECDTDYSHTEYHESFLNPETGDIILPNGERIESKEFCLEYSLKDNNREHSDFTSSAKIFTCSKHSSVQQFATEPKSDVRFTMYSAGLLISVIFLSATLAAGFLMPSNHHVLHWRCQTYYVACLLVGDLLLAITQISSDTIHGFPCIFIGNLMHFFFLSAFFWLNTMCFNIWWTFRDFRPTSLEKGQEMFRLRIYWLYAWGVPLIITLIAGIFEMLPKDLDEDILRPGFLEGGCWFGDDKQILTYFFGPIGVLLCINILLFGSTARQLTCGLWKRDDVKSTTERAALGRVCLKLVIVMGITWVADIMSWLIGGPQYAWYVTDLINALQGVFIFIVVGCQPQVWSALKRIWSSRTGRNTATTTHGPQHSSSSHGLPSIGETVTNNTLTNTTSTKVPMETIC